MKNFSSLLEVMREFDTVEKCKAHLALVRWNGSPACVHCGATRIYTTNRGYKCAECLKKFTVTVGTIYEGSKIPLTKWFLAEYIITAHKKGISSHQLGRDLGITQKSAWFLGHRIREQIRVKQRGFITGTVEVDETFIGGKAKNKHEWQRKKLIENGTGYVNKTPVFGILERGGDVRTFKVDKADGLTLKPIILANLAPGAELITDGFGGYKDLNKFYYHTIVNHAKGVWVEGGKHTNTLEGFWGLLKRGIDGIYHQVSPKHLHRYCDEFAYRYNTRKVKDGDRFNLSMNMVEGCRLTYKQLIAS